jgi:flagellar hook-basal body complex protein FliE
MPIPAIGGVFPGLSAPSSTTSPASAAEQSGGAFADSLGRLVDAVKTSSGAANDAVGGMLNGSADVHDAMIALQRADLTLQLTVQVRNKLVDAYQEIMRMPV